MITSDHHDVAAKAAAEGGEDDPSIEVYSDALAGAARLGANWPSVVAPPVVTAACADEGADPYWLADSLDAPLPKQAERVFQNRIRARHPNAPPGGASPSMLDRLLDLLLNPPPGSPGILPESITAIWRPQFTARETRLALLLRFDQFRFGKHLARFGHGLAACTLCGAGVADSQAHALGGCQHVSTHAMVCARHGGGIQLARAAAARALDCPVLADAEGHEPRFEQPAWLLTGRRASTPDLLVIPGLSGVVPASADKRQFTVVLLELFETYDTNMAAKWADKSDQHDVFASQLIRSDAGRPGWRAVESLTSGVSHSGLLTGNLLTKISWGKAGSKPYRWLQMSRSMLCGRRLASSP